MGPIVSGFTEGPLLHKASLSHLPHECECVCVSVCGEGGITHKRVCVYASAEEQEITARQTRVPLITPSLPG